MSEIKSIGISEIIRRMVEKSNSTGHPFSQAEARAAINLLKSVVFDVVKEGNKAQITSFVSFKPVYRTARNANNVLTNEPVVIPEGIVVMARPGSGLKAAVKSITSDTETFSALKSLKK